MKRYKPVFIGITFIIAIFLFIWGYNFLKGKNIFKKEVKYYAKYDDVSGLTVANPVMINGLRIGQVSSIIFDQDMSGNIIVELVLHKDFPIPANTIARIFSADLMGSKMIDLRLGDAIDLAKAGDTLASSTEASLKDEVNAQVQPIKVKAENLLSSIDSLVVAIQTVFNESARESLKRSFDNISQTFRTWKPLRRTLIRLWVRKQRESLQYFKMWIRWHTRLIRTGKVYQTLLLTWKHLVIP